MTLKATLALITDELGAMQIKVTLVPTDSGVVIQAEDYAAMVIARHELKRRGIIVSPA